MSGEQQPNVWVVDDDARVRTYLSDFLATRGFQVQGFDSAEPLVGRLDSPSLPSLLILDIRMPHFGGLELLAEIEKRNQRIPTIVLSGVDQISTVVKAMRLGASDYLPKPLDEDDLELAIEKAMEEGSRRSNEHAVYAGPDVVLPASKKMQHVRDICDQVARADVPVLILGESGVGKEVVARYIHAQSGRTEPFAKVNCAALPSDLLESEVFGHERGAFTGALRDKPGKFELAGRGTLLLDEIAEMSPLLQAKLLHVLQDGEYSRLGGTRTLRSEARILAATNKRLSLEVANKTFREDLYFRLNVIVIEVPPLRERPEDILSLSQRFVDQYRGKYKSSLTRLPRELQEAFLRFHWPGNVRQLENAVRRFLILPDLSSALAELRATRPVSEPAAVLSLKELSATAAEKTEKEVILRTLEEVHWNRKQAARRLNICYKSLLSKLRRWESNERPDADGFEDEETKLVAAGPR